MRLSLRKQLLLLGLVTLVLPLAGWQFVRGLEGHLRDGQAAALTDSAEVLSRVIAAEKPLLPRPGPLFFTADSRAPFRLDGNGDDWAALRGQQQCFTADVVADESPARLCVLLARYGGALHLLADVDDATVVREPRRGDALRLLIDDGGVRAYRFSSQEGRLGMVAEDEHPLPAIRGEWAERDGGYRVELRFPPGWQARRIGIEALDRTSVDGNAIRIGSAPDRLGGLWPLAQRDDDLGRRIGRLVPPGLHVRLLSLDGWVLADAGKLAQVRGGPLPEWRRWLYDLLVGETPEAPVVAMPDRLLNDEVARVAGGDAMASATHAEPGLQLRLSAVVPLRAGAETVALLSVERRSEAAYLAQRALSGLLGLTLLAMLAVGGVLLAYASWLALRLRRLGRAVDAAMIGDGQRRTRFVESGARDEVGDLSRRFARLLDEVDGYTDYLRSLAGKLSHELHTPLAVVRTSLENLEAQSLPAEAEPYVGRARDGATRLAAIVRAMSEATRVERAIAGADAEDFELRELVNGCADGYRPLLGARKLELLLPSQPLPFTGAPELLAQALDKLVDNARDFCPAEGWIAIALGPAERGDGIEIAVANQGTTLNPEISQRLFDSLVSHRDRAPCGGDAPHLGLGLYIVRLVAELHRGEVIARDLPNRDGVEFRLRLRGMDRTGDSTTA
ncbi:MAG: histidine kinase [Xanthomonadales bacterium]|nr:histidine kinase [Xanthomonadales bacterium]